ncbi:hypothetical protein pb186bvf_016942 [Paramecium bursaria]
MSQASQPKFQKVLIISSLMILEVISLAFYGDENEMDRWDRYGSDYLIFLQISIAGSILMVLGLLLTTIVIFKQNYCIIYSAAITLTFGVLVLLVGMGFGAQFYTDKYQEHYYYDTPIAFWFGQLAIYVIAMVEIFCFHSDHSVQQKDSQLHLPITQHSDPLYNPTGK